jgi:hypothetical protein
VCRGHCGRDHMVVGFTTTYAISAYHHYCCEFESLSWQGVPDTTLFDKFGQWLAAGQWFSLDTLVSSTYKTDCHNITEILLKVAFKTRTLTLIIFCVFQLFNKMHLTLNVIWNLYWITKRNVLLFNYKSLVEFYCKY